MTPTIIEQHHIETSEFHKGTLIKKLSQNSSPTEKGELPEPIQMEESRARERARAQFAKPKHSPRDAPPMTIRAPASVATLLSATPQSRSPVAAFVLPAPRDAFALLNLLPPIFVQTVRLAKL
jgi:hypothetical protein